MNIKPDQWSRALPMFDADADIWDGLDEAAQEQVLDCLGLLLLRHRHQAACDIPQEPSTKGTHE